VTIRCQKGAKEVTIRVHPQCEFNTENERKIIDLLRDNPQQHSYILKESKLPERTVNRLLKKMCANWKIFRAPVDGKPFYKLNLFNPSVFGLFALVEGTKKYNRKWAPLLTEIKNDVLLNCPNIPYKQIIRRWRIHLNTINPQATEATKALKFLERMA